MLNLSPDLCLGCCVDARNSKYSRDSNQEIPNVDESKCNFDFKYNENIGVSNFR